MILSIPVMIRILFPSLTDMTLQKGQKGQDRNSSIIIFYYFIAEIISYKGFSHLPTDENLCSISNAK